MCLYSQVESSSTQSKSFGALHVLPFRIKDAKSAGMRLKKAKLPSSSTKALRNEITLFSWSNIAILRL